MWKPDICMHHFPCDDGFASAWAVWHKWADTVEYRPTNYGQPVPDADIDGKNILIADFSFKPDVLQAIAKRAASIVILDHHKTAKEDLADFNVTMTTGTFDTEYVPHVLRDFAALQRPPVIAHFDMEKSGARLTWEFCHPDKFTPALIKHIEDRDLWRLQYPETRALSLYLRSFPYDFELWDQIVRRFELEREAVLSEAIGIERFYDRKLAELIPVAVRWQVVNNHRVPVLNVPWAFASDAAHELLKAYPDAPFAAAYFDNGDGRTYSLRSEDNREDVSQIARKYGGGGHRNAAGFRMPL